MKQAIIVRKDLKMDCGKIAGQVAHASVKAVKSSDFVERGAWEIHGETKIVLKVYSEEELIELFEKATKNGLNVAAVRDLGKTQIPKGTLTAIAIGPHINEKVDEVIKELKLL
jgi:PTH2 family peptidyl-tRNA hydrolase